MSNNKLCIKSYGKYSWVVRCKEGKEGGKDKDELKNNVILKKIGGHYSETLQGGEGWLFAKGVHDKALDMFFSNESFFDDEKAKEGIYVVGEDGCGEECKDDKNTENPDDDCLSDTSEFEETANRLRSYYYTSKFTVYAFLIGACITICVYKFL